MSCYQIHWLGEAGQPWGGDACSDAVVESHDTDVAADVQSTLAACLECADGKRVADAREGRWWCLPVEQSANEFPAGADLVGPADCEITSREAV